MPRRAIAVPMSDQVVTPKTGMATDTWIDFFLEQARLLAATPQRLIVSDARAQDASIGVTTPAVALHGPGLYRVSYYLRVVRPGAVSSSIAVTLHWKDQNVSVTLPFPALTTNTTSAVSTGTALARADSANVLAYSTTYASAGTPAMLYDLVISVELVN